MSVFKSCTAILITTVDLMDATVSELLAAMNDGRLTAVQLTQMYIDRIETYDKALGLNSIIAIHPEALEQAKEADAKRAAGESLGRLHGIPVVIKDNIDVAGMATTAGDAWRSYAVASYDAEIVTRLKEEGAIILAKTNMAEYAASGANSRSSMGGIVHNAYDLSRTPAGSSGGSAVAVTCNFAAVGIGTDTGSSIRRPASFANLYGMRPSFGLVSNKGLFYLHLDQDTIGPICRNAEDLALMLDVLAGTDYVSTAIAKENGLEGKRIGYLANSFGYTTNFSTNQPLTNPILMDEKIVPMVEAAKVALQDGGAELVDLSQLLNEATISSLRYNQSKWGMEKFREQVTALLEEQHIDAVMYVSQTDVPPLEEESVYEKTNNTATYINAFGPLAGLPEIMIPMGFAKTDEETPNPLPLGLSLFSGYGKDAILLEIAYAYDQITDVRQQPQTTPALPDAALQNYGEALLEQTDLDLADYTTETATALTQARNDLAELSMTDGPAQYQQAVVNLLSAYGALTLVPPPTEPATIVPTVPTIPVTEHPRSEEAEASEQTSNGLLFCAVFFVAISIVLFGCLFEIKKKESGRKPGKKEASHSK